MIAVSRALLDVLFASLWQDAIVGLCAGALLYFAGKRLNAATRHVILQGALFAMLLVPVVTTLPHITLTAASIGGYGTAASATAGNGSSALNVPGSHSINVVLSGPITLAVAALWLAGTIALLLRIMLGVAQLVRIVRGSERHASRNGVPVYASSRIPVPVAFGLMRPAIVIPSELLDEAGVQLECVLLHELAHVQRRDVWFHTFERFVHALLFFNPAVVLLLQSLELEREAACDDWAVAHSRDTEAYTHSLAVLAVRTSFNIEMPAACGAIGFGHGIVNRIERLEDARRNGSLFLSPFALGGFTFVLLSIVFAFELLAPAVAFAPQPKITQPAVAASSCRRDAAITFPATPQGSLPAGKVVVLVSVSSSGAASATKILQSSGNAVLDRDAVNLAKENGYEPAMRNCKPVAGTYTFVFTSAGAK